MMQTASSAIYTPCQPSAADEMDRTEINGAAMRKGTVAAFLQNAMRYGASDIDDAAREALEREIVAAVPALRALGVFAIFEVRDARLRTLIAAA